MNLGEFKSLLRDAIKRGDSYDSQLDGLIRRAARWIEQNYTMQYMRRLVRVQSVAGSDTILLPTNVPVKSLNFLRFIGGDRIYVCRKSTLENQDTCGPWLDRYGDWPETSKALFPTEFYMDGVESIVFNRAFSEVLPGEGLLIRYTDFPTEDSQTHWLLQYAEGLLLRQALVEFMVLARDDRGYTVAKLQREEDIKALMNADFDAQFTGQDLQWS